jgi:hypothetical protein
MKKITVSLRNKFLEELLEVNWRPTVSRPVYLNVGLTSEADDQIFVLFCVTTAGFLMFGPSLTRRWICSLLVQLFRGITKAVTLGSKCCRTHGHVLLSRLKIPQPGSPGPHIYILPEQSSPVVPPGTGFPFRRLLGLAGLRLRYSTPSRPSTRGRVEELIVLCPLTGHIPNRNHSSNDNLLLPSCNVFRAVA